MQGTLSRAGRFKQTRGNSFHLVSLWNFFDRDAVAADFYMSQKGLDVYFERKKIC